MLRNFAIFILLLFSVNAWSGTVKELRLSNTDEQSRLVIDLTAATKYKSFTLKKPDRIVFDLQNTSLHSSLIIPDLSGSPIKKIRSAQRGDTFRIVLDLEKALRYSSDVLKPDQTRSHRIVIDLVTGNTSKPKSNKQKPKTPQKVITPTQPEQTAQPKTEPSKPIPIKLKPKRDIVIAIDPGHGGKDSGAIGPNGTQEKKIVLSIAKRLAALIKKEPGMRAYMTRSGDHFISLRERINRAHQQKADMFISIHADAFTNRNAKGASVYVLSEHGASSEAAKLLADKENASDLVGGISLEDKPDLLASVLLDLSQTASLEASVEVANSVLSGLKRVGNVHKKQVESAAFVVLKSPDIPSILVETAFISNPSEEMKLNTASHQNKLAKAIMTGIRSYFRRNPLPGTNLPQKHIVNSGETLSTIAKRYQISLQDLKKENNLTSSKIRIGQVLVIP